VHRNNLLKILKNEDCEYLFRISLISYYFNQYAYMYFYFDLIKIIISSAYYYNLEKHIKTRKILITVEYTSLYIYIRNIQIK